MRCQPPHPRWDSPNHEGDLKIGFCQHFQALPLRGACLDPPTPPSAAPRDRPPRVKHHPDPWILGWIMETQSLPVKHPRSPSRAPLAPLQGTRTPVSPRGVPHTQRRHHGTPSPHKPAAERGAWGAPPIPKTPAMHRGSSGTAACPCALKAQPPPRRAWQAQPTFRGATGTHRGGRSHQTPIPAAPTVRRPEVSAAAGPSRTIIPLACNLPGEEDEDEERSPAQLPAKLQITCI